MSLLLLLLFVAFGTGLTGLVDLLGHAAAAATVMAYEVAHFSLSLYGAV